jgi:hypothetical protein
MEAAHIYVCSLLSTSAVTLENEPRKCLASTGSCGLLPLGSVGVHHTVFKKLLVTIAPCFEDVQQGKPCCGIILIRPKEKEQHLQR